MKEIIEILLLIVLLLLAALTAGSEIAIIAASRIKLRKLSSEGSKAARIVLKILETPEKFFSTILVTNNIIDSLIAVIVTAMFIRLMGGQGVGLAVATIISSFLIIVFEVTAKTMATRYSDKMSLVLARPMRIMIKLFTPVVKALELTIKIITRIIGARKVGTQSLVTEEEIRALIKIGEEEGILHKEKVKMLSKVFDFSNAIVRTMMTSKREVVSINVAAKLDDIIDTVVESGYSRLPVYKDSPENIIGIINMKDLLSLSYNKDLIVMQDLMYPATFVPGSKKVTELLKEFQKGHTHIAIVTDDKGTVEGIVTLEDLVEEIVGEIEDEYDVRASNYKAKHLA